MLKYVLRRLGYIMICFFVISIFMFALFKSIPGDPVIMIMEGAKDTLTPEQYQIAYDQARKKLGLDDNIIVQYLRWIGRMVTGDFGYSIFYRMPVSSVVKKPLLNTALLNIVNIFFAFSIATFLGIQAALKKGTWVDQVVQVITVLGNSIPTFIIAILLILIFAINLGWLPVSGMYTPDFQGTQWEFVLDRLRHMVLPMLTLLLHSLGGLTRYVRTNMLEALSMDSIRTARAKGLKEKTVIFSHAFRNALIPIITVTASWFINIFGGTVALERVFNWNGMGKIMIDSLQNKDFSVAMAMNMFFAVLALVGNLIVDLCYGLADPRIRFD